MESWPLQLVLSFSGKHEQVVLANNVRIIHQGVEVDPKALKPGQHLRIMAKTPLGEISEVEIVSG